MKIFLVGLSDIGKSTIGSKLAKKIDYKFFDFDIEVEEFYNTPISHIQSQFITEYSYRVHLSVVLKKIIEEN
ncbi:MAG: shikimate kinase, partial [Candidatus Hodarchaeales archaeon]